MDNTYTPWKGMIVVGALFFLFAGGSAWGVNVSGCTEKTCTWEISVDGNVVEQGS